MLRFTRNTVIAFDFKDALSFEGETGPYVQYAIVRAANIFRKANTTEAESLAAIATLDLIATFSTPKREAASGRPGSSPPNSRSSSSSASPPPSPPTSPSTPSS